jgi:hypothetical protein
MAHNMYICHQHDKWWFIFYANHWICTLLTYGESEYYTLTEKYRVKFSLLTNNNLIQKKVLTGCWICIYCVMSCFRIRITFKISLKNLVRMKNFYFIDESLQNTVPSKVQDFQDTGENSILNLPSVLSQRIVCNTTSMFFLSHLLFTCLQIICYMNFSWSSARRQQMPNNKSFRQFFSLQCL